MSAPNHNNNKSAPSRPQPLFRSAVIGVCRPESIHQHELVWQKEDPVATTNSTPTVLSGGWDRPQLTPIGLYYPLGACHVRIARDRFVHVQRILPEVFRILSLQTTFHNTPVSATCLSMDQVEIKVALFADRTNSGELIVEIERTCGDSVLFHEYADAIKNALTLGELPACGRPTTANWNQALFERMESIGKAAGEQDLDQAVENVWSLLSTNRYDAQKLALESLLHMTDPRKSGVSVAIMAAERLMFPKNERQLYISRSVFEMAMTPTATSDSEMVDLSLAVFAQTLQMAAESSQTIDLAAFLAVCPGDLVGRLLGMVDNVQTRPHQAYHAVQSLFAMCSAVPSVRAQIINKRAVEEAHMFGASYHLALAAASQRLLVCLQA